MRKNVISERLASVVDWSEEMGAVPGGWVFVTLSTVTPQGSPQNDEEQAADCLKTTVYTRKDDSARVSDWAPNTLHGPLSPLNCRA